MSVSAVLPVARVEAANATLEAQGFGPGSFSVPLRSGGAGEATHAGLHAWDNPALLSALEGIEGCVISDVPGFDVAFGLHVAAQALDWTAPVDWFENPVMAGDERSHEGKTWVSLVDFNVWEPPVAWREVVAEGYPAWVQPTGAHDAYGIGDRVTFEGVEYESAIDGNVWSPTAYPAGWVAV